MRQNNNQQTQGDIQGQESVKNVATEGYMERSGTKSPTNLTTFTTCVKFYYLGLISTFPVIFWYCQNFMNDGCTFACAPAITLTAAADLNCMSSGIPARVGSMRRALVSRNAFSRVC